MHDPNLEALKAGLRQLRMPPPEAEIKRFDAWLTKRGRDTKKFPPACWWGEMHLKPLYWDRHTQAQWIGWLARSEYERNKLLARAKRNWIAHPNRSAFHNSYTAIENEHVVWKLLLEWAAYYDIED